jgi:preprotein translocase subunit SecA
VAADEPIADEAPKAGCSADDLAAARGALDEARRLIGRPRALEGESLESTRIAYAMELAEHRSTTERAHRAELAAKDATIAQQRYEITDLRRRLAESEADIYRLRIALQVLTGRPLPETALPDDDASSTVAPERSTDPPNG